MGNIFKPILRHLVAGAVGAAAGYVTLHSGIDMQQAIEPITSALVVGVYGAVNHLIKLVFPGTRGAV